MDPDLRDSGFSDAGIGGGASVSGHRCPDVPVRASETGCHRDSARMTPRLERGRDQDDDDDEELVETLVVVHEAAIA